jgi:hypothetical protein
MKTNAKPLSKVSVKSDQMSASEKSQRILIVASAFPPIASLK